jgi:hypothetical protein
MHAAATVDQRPSNRWLYAGIALLLAASISVQMVRDRGWAPFVPPNPAMWLQSGPVAGRLALSFDNLVADIYWIRAVVYYGSKRELSTETQTAAAQAANFASLNPLLELVTSLDPHFKAAYRFGAIFLAEAYPSGPGRPDLAVALLERGIANDSGRWEYFEDIGFIYYWWLHDFQKASDWFRRAAQQPGAPTWLEPLAATTLAAGGDRQSSRFLWKNILESTDIDWLRSQATFRLQQLDAMDTITDLAVVLRRFIARERRTPASWEELVEKEHLPRVPVDPAGVRFVFDPKVGYVDVSRRSPMWPLPDDPERLRVAAPR